MPELLFGRGGEAEIFGEFTTFIAERWPVDC